MTKATATKAPAITKAAVSAIDTAAFLAAHREGNALVLTKIRTVGRATLSGSVNGDIAKAFNTACLAAKLSAPADGFTSAVSQYAAAFTAANTHKLAADDTALQAAFSVSTGVVKAADRDAFVAGFKGRSAAAFAKGCAELLAAAKLAKAAAAATKGAKGAKAPAAKDEATIETAVALTPATFAELVAALGKTIGSAQGDDKIKMIAVVSAMLATKAAADMVENATAAAPVPVKTSAAHVAMVAANIAKAEAAAAKNEQDRILVLAAKVKAQRAANRKRAAKIEI